MQRLQLIKKILGINLLLFSLVSYADSIGDITEHKGSAGLTRQTGETLPTDVGIDIMSLDHIVTANGRMKIQFVDDTKLSLTEQSEVTIDEYYFDPDPSKSKMAMSFVSGTARFATGKLGLVPRENIIIQTPTATIGIRGTDFTTSVDELGRSLVILLPETECTIDGDCSPSGEITVTNDGGTVTLSEAYQATMVSSFDQSPVQPVTLENINVNMIDNMFIVSPPEKIVEAVEDEQGEADNTDPASILDFTDLDVNELDEDKLKEEDMEFTELDMDLLNVDFLQDLLTTIEEVDVLKKRTGADETGNIVGTVLGFDKDTQYNTIIDKGAGTIWFYREVNGIISVKVPISANLTLESENEGKRNLITVNDGESIVIIIRQGG